MNRISWLRTALIAVLTVPFVLPFFYVISVALKPIDEYNLDQVGLPQNPTLDNFAQAWTGTDLGASLLHSAIAVATGLVVGAAASSSAAFWFYRYRGRVASVLRAMIIATMAVPAAVFVLPLFVGVSRAGLSNNLVVLGLVYAGASGGLGLYIMSTHFREAIPSELVEAAEMDGASALRQYWSIFLPLGAPAIATYCTLAFIFSWGELLLASVLVRSEERRTAATAAALLADEYSLNVPVTAAAVVIILSPMLVVFAVGQKYLQAGLTGGSHK